MNTWILISNASEAQVYRTNNNLVMDRNQHRPELIKQLQHPGSRDKEADLISDRAGYFHGKNEGHGDFIEPTDPKDTEANRFARELAELLEEARIEKSFEQLIVVAPPQFHGLLNKHMNKNVSRMIKKHIEKDYTKDNINDLIDHLQTYL